MRVRCLVSLLVALAMGAGLAQAQPDTRNAPKAANPPAWPQMGDWQNMTPAQRQEAMKKLVNDTLRGSLAHIGVLDEKTQTTIVQFAEAQEKSKQTVRGKAHKVAQALLDNTQTETQVTALLKELRQAVDDAKAAQKADVATLEELTGYSKKPKLQAFLTMMGLIGDETLFMHGVFGNYLNALGILADPPAPAPEQAPPAAAPK